MTVRNKANNNQSVGYGITTWTKKGMIEKGATAVQVVLDSPAMPITAADQFEAVIVLFGNNQMAEIPKDFSPSADLYSITPNQTSRTITITDIDVPTELQTLDPEPPIEKPDISGPNNGDTIVIDGIEWIKVRTDTTNPNLVLLMLKGVTGPCVEYNNIRKIVEYNATNPPSIRSYVDTWYAALNAPTLKKIAWEVNIGATPYQSWPGKKLAGETNYTKVAFVPMLSDISHLMKANNHRYWLADIYQDKTTLCWHNSIIQGNGDFVTNGVIPDLSNVYVRPCIWVTSQF
jgi:hypothetical protein